MPCMLLHVATCQLYCETAPVDSSLENICAPVFTATMQLTRLGGSKHPSVLSRNVVSGFHVDVCSQ